MHLDVAMYESSFLNLKNPFILFAIFELSILELLTGKEMKNVDSS